MASKEALVAKVIARLVGSNVHLATFDFDFCAGPGLGWERPQALQKTLAKLVACDDQRCVRAVWDNDGRDLTEMPLVPCYSTRTRQALALRLTWDALRTTVKEMPADKRAVTVLITQFSIQALWIDTAMRYRCFPTMPSDARSNKAVALAAVAAHSSNLQFAPPEFVKDKAFMIAACKLNGCALRMADPVLQNDRDVVLAAVQNDAYAIRYASDTLRKDPDVVLAAHPPRPRVVGGCDSLNVEIDDASSV